MGTDLARLDDDVRGRVIRPGDDGYDEARQTFYGGIDKHPAAIVRVADVDDVAAAVRAAASNGAELAVRSGGHSIPGHSVSEGGIVIDLADLTEIEVDADDRTAWAGAGLTAGDYTTVTNAAGMATGFGDTGSVGIGGITLGGGVGFLARAYGLTIDSLLDAELVTADGTVVRVDAEEDPDLFWAIRGGGGNFGVVTSFRYRLHPVDRIVGGMLFLPATGEVVDGFMAAAAAAPRELSTICNVMTAPPMPFLPEALHGTPIVMAFLVYAGDDAGAAEKVLAPFKALAEPLADMVRPMAYPEMYPPEEEAMHPIATAHTGFIDGFGADEADLVMTRVPEPGAVMRVVQLRELGGAIADVADDATAYAHRGRRIMVNVASLYDDVDRRAADGPWVADLADAIHGDDRTGYVNFLGDEGPERIRQAYPGATWDRLRQLKGRYDPDNLFRLNQNIPPA